MTTTRTATDFRLPIGPPPYVSRERGPDVRSIILAIPSGWQDAGFVVRRIEADGARLCPCLRLQWLYGL